MNTYTEAILRQKKSNCIEMAGVLVQNEELPWVCSTLKMAVNGRTSL